MKNHLVLILTLIFGFSLTTNAQEKENDEMQYLFQNGVQVSGFGGATVSFGQVENEFATFTGGGGAALINQKFFIGGFGEGLATQHKRDEIRIEGIDYNDVYTSFGYGGLWIGYIHEPNKMIHLKASLKLAGGALSITDSFEDLYDELYDDVVFVAIPEVGVQVNVLPWMRVGLDAGFRHVGSVDNTRNQIDQSYVFSASDFSGLHTTLSFMFGGFR